jgi:hypothetical protein
MPAASKVLLGFFENQEKHEPVESEQIDVPG